MTVAQDKDAARAALASMSMRKLRASEDFWKSERAQDLRIDGRPPIFWLVERAHEAKQEKNAPKRTAALSAMTWLLSRGLSVDQPYRNLTPLMEAAGIGDLAAARRLVNAGAQVNKPSLIGNTPLHWAAIGGRPGVARFLIATGASLDAVNHSRQTPLHCAADRMRMNTITVLHEAGSAWDPRDVHDRTPLEILRLRDPALAKLWTNRPEWDRLEHATPNIQSSAAPRPRKSRL